MLVKSFLLVLGACAFTVLTLHIFVHSVCVEPLPAIPTVQHPAEDFFRSARPISDHYAAPVVIGDVTK